MAIDGKMFFAEQILYLLFAGEKGKKDSAKFINNMGEQYD